MRPWAVAAAVAAMLAGGLAPGAAADDQPAPGPTPAPAVPPSHLKLGPDAGFNLPRNEFVVPELPHFETQVEVHSRHPQEAMFDWWEHFHFESAIYGAGINVQKPVGGGYNILPVIDWLKKKKKKSMPEDEPEPPPQP
jgi:hypothetical protein